ncbi:YhfH family protein [Oceanobacillus arenosus]|uniref:YhfH family protein n=2 Tax=Oceanobacillus TaxID=182709 RepID=A0A345PFF9_9BACI|nr:MULTISPECIES: protein YhfH [Oceanobacillus]AXI08739.1 YhfH family protein [Oceanobacillus zhaokaii]QGS68468.1 YhfH family protein [Oceanobacillus sp. 143]RDW18229.1 YhfH family protein [Oceanobacillus arenosus]
MENVIEFFKNLPNRKCDVCGQDIVEKADCYGHVCDECDHPAR